MNIYSTFIIVFLSILTLQAQNKSTKIEAAKIAYIKEKIELSETQELSFWAIYNEYLDKKQAIRKQIKLLKTESGSISTKDEQLKIDLEKLFVLREQELLLEKDYYTIRLLNVISLRQIIELQKAEKQFTLLLIKKLEDIK